MNNEAERDETIGRLERIATQIAACRAVWNDTAFRYPDDVSRLTDEIVTALELLSDGHEVLMQMAAIFAELHPITADSVRGIHP